MNPMTATLIWTALQVTLLGGATLAAYAIARRLSPQLSAAVLVTGLSLALVLTLLAASPWPRWGLPTDSPVASPAPPAAAEVITGQVEAPAAEPAPAKPVELPAAPVEQVALADYAAHLWNALQQPAPPVAVDERPTNWLLWIVVVGVGLGVVRLGWGLVSVRRLLLQSKCIEDVEIETLLARTCRQLGLAQSIAVRESAQLATPATVGWWRPSLLLPKQWRQWTDDERQVVVAHELAHVAGRDFAGWIIARLVVALHFYHPLVHWLASRLQLEQELAADATAAELLGNRQRYLHTLAGLALATPHHNLSGAARALIPGRSLLMRRVEMLRSPLKTIPNRAFASRLRWAQCGLLAVVALGIAGLRAPSLAEAQTAAPAEVAKSGTEMERIPLSLVPPETIYVASIRPAELFASDALKPLAAKLGEAAPPLKGAGVTVHDIAEVMLCVPEDNSRYVVRTTSEQACDRLLKWMVEKHAVTEGQPAGMLEVEGTELKTWRSKSEQCTRLDKQTLVIDEVRSAPGFTVPPMENPSVSWADEWTSRDDQHVALAFNNGQLWESQSPDEKTALANRGFMPMIMPAVQHVDLVFANVTVDSDLKVGGVITTDSQGNAEKIKSTLKALFTLGQNAVDAQKARLGQMPPDVQKAVSNLLDEGGKLLREAKVDVDGSRVTVDYVGEGEAASVAVATGLLLPAVESARAEARRNASTNNMKQLALAVHNYAAVHNELPRAASKRYFHAATGKWRESVHAHSWRVAILPYLDQQNLYDQYRFDEPWNSEANLEVMEQMPGVFRDPGATGDKYHTTYFALTGKDTMFPEGEGMSLDDVRDGASLTILLVEAKRDVPWTKPEDIPYAHEAALPELGGHHELVFIAAFVDGSVRMIHREIDVPTLRGMITPAGGEMPGGAGIFDPAIPANTPRR